MTLAVPTKHFIRFFPIQTISGLFGVRHKHLTEVPGGFELVICLVPETERLSGLQLNSEPFDTLLNLNRHLEF